MTETPTARLSPRRRTLVGVGIVLLLALAATAWSGFRVLQARDQLETGRAELEVARRALLDRDLPAARASITRAGEKTAQARRLVDDPVTTVLSHVPFAGRSLAVVRGVARGADEIARNVLPVALQAADRLDPKALRRADGSIDLAVIAAAEPMLAQASREATAVAKRAAELPDSLLPGVVQGPRVKFVAQAEQLESALRGAADATKVAPPMLGRDRAQRYFVMVQQTSESRGTGGLPGGFAILEARAGRLRVTEEGSNADLVNKTVPPRGLPTDYVERYRDLGAFDIWQNVNVSPDLPVVAKAIAQRWRAQGGAPIDGVFALDAIALRDLLEGSGPVPLSGGRTLAPDQVEDYLALGQYEGRGDDQGARKEELSEVASAVTERLTTGGGDSTALVKGISRALRSGHLRLTSDDPAVAEVLRRDGVDGGLPRTAVPFAYPVVFNSTGGKLDYFLDRTVTWKAGDCDGSRRRSTVEVTLTNRAPAVATLPSYVSILLRDGVLTHSDTSEVGLSVYATKGARLVGATLDGKALKTDFSDPRGVIQPGTEAGLPVWLTYVDLPPGKPVTLRLTLDEPTSQGRPKVYEQPLARAQKATVHVPTCR